MPHRRKFRPELRPPVGLAARSIQAGGSDLAILWFPIGSRGELTEVEHEIVHALLAGQRNAEIARERGTASRTVANQIASIFRKLGVRSRAELVAQAALLGGSIAHDEG
jgi:DNA-binding CsgD family transcriptional regulator